MYGSPGGGGPQHTWSSDPTPNAPGYGGGGYGAGYGAYGAVPQQPVEPPGTVLKVFGILGISFGAINLLYNAFGILQAFLQMRQWERVTETQPTGGGAPLPSMGTMQNMLDASIKLTFAHNTVMILMDIALIVVGILLLQRKEIGRKLAILWAGVGLIVLVGRAVSFEIFVMPYIDEMLSGLGKGSNSPMLTGGMFSAFARVGTYLSLAFMAVWPITLLVSMNLQSVKNAIKQPSA